MRAFLVVAAALVGLANAILYSLVSDNNLDRLFELEAGPPSLLLLYVLCAVFVGLAISGVLLMLAERDLREGFFARYGLMVLSVCAGGVVLAPFLTTVTFFFDAQAYAPATTSRLLSAILFSALPGGVLGATEGVVLGLPLAALLGLFRGETGAQKVAR